MSLKNETILEAYRRGYRIDKRGILFNPKGKEMSPTIGSGGYYRHTFRLVEGKVSSPPIHRFQAFQKFKYDIFKEGIVVRHKDGNKLNNHYDNILIGTYSDNMMDIPEDIRKRTSNIASKAAVPFSRRFNNTKTKEIIQDRQEGMTYKELCKKYNTSKSTLSYFFNNSQYVKDLKISARSSEG